MPLYEIVLRLDGVDEIRVTNVPPKVGSTFRARGQEWLIVRGRRGTNSRIAGRFVAAPRRGAGESGQ